jgi:predicted peptidase
MSADPFQPVSFTRTVTRTVTLNYLLRHPPGYRQDQLRPAVLFLHGAGAKGDDPGKVQNEALPRLVREGMDFPFLLVCPQCPDGVQGWPIDDLAVLVRALREQYPIDPERLYLTGISMGGRGVWEYAYSHAGSLAAIAPVCGFGIPNLAPRLRDLPVWAFHGEHDDVLPAARTDEMVHALKQTGNPVRYTRLAGIGHSCGRIAYSNPELWAWLAGRRRADTSDHGHGAAMVL